MKSVRFCQVSANEIECRISWKVSKFEFEISWKVSANETRADASKFRHWNTQYQLRHMASNLLTRTALLPRQWQPLTDVDPFESPTLKIDILIFFVENIKGFGEVGEETYMIRFRIFLRTNNGQKMKDTDVKTLARNSRFCSIFPDRRS